VSRPLTDPYHDILAESNSLIASLSQAFDNLGACLRKSCRIACREKSASGRSDSAEGLPHLIWGTEIILNPMLRNLDLAQADNVQELAQPPDTA